MKEQVVKKFQLALKVCDAIRKHCRKRNDIYQSISIDAATTLDAGHHQLVWEWLRKNCREWGHVSITLEQYDCETMSSTTWMNHNYEKLEVAELVMVDTIRKANSKTAR